ncbi:MAG: ferredoxin [Lactobacillales bacterium]|jgi:ferredoxin|nr:ferredoxin [Lactobacillales bacterium]
MSKDLLCTILPEECIACGLCAIYAPDIFDYDDDGLVLFKDTNAKEITVSNSKKEELLVAYRKCPVRAIIIHEKNA